ncbi:MAG: GNAT family N-acetyltransferase [Candidatus Kapabacteria bacterium]|nr:GNAT family N-acetyltransferase [Candidatus Kapabacteria bacterium]
MGSNHTIRPFEYEDFESFFTIQREALERSPELFGSDYSWFASLSRLSVEQRFERYLNYPYTYLLGCFGESGEILGMIGFSSDQSIKLRHKGRVWGLYVRESARGKGIASALTASVIEIGRDVLGIEQISCSVSSQNQASYNHYLRIGFTIYGTELHALKIGDTYVDEYLMVRFLI